MLARNNYFFILDKHLTRCFLLAWEKHYLKIQNVTKKPEASQGKQLFFVTFCFSFRSHAARIRSDIRIVNYLFVNRRNIKTPVSVRIVVGVGVRVPEVTGAG